MLVYDFKDRWQQYTSDMDQIPKKLDGYLQDL